MLTPQHHQNLNILEISPTQFGKDNEVFSIALRAGDASCAVAPLLLVDPALQTDLVHPLGGAAAAARTHPLSRAVVFICGKAHPAAPESRERTMTTLQYENITLEREKTKRGETMYHYLSETKVTT